MSNTSRSIALAALAGATLLTHALPASAAIRGGGNFGGGHFGGSGRSGIHGGAIHLTVRRPGGPTTIIPTRGHFPPRGPVYGWRHHHHFPAYGGPIIPVALATGAVIATAPGGTAAAAPAPACTVPAGSFVTVTFLPTATAADITNFLQSYNVSLAAGPDKDGVYKILLSDQTLPQARIADVIASMRSQAAIVQSVEG